MLESQQAAQAVDPQVQLDFGEPAADPVRDAIDALDPDSMSPREALDALYRLKDL